MARRCQTAGEQHSAMFPKLALAAVTLVACQGWALCQVEWAVEIRRPSDAQAVARYAGCHLLRVLHLVGHFAIVSCPHGGFSASGAATGRRIRRHAGVQWAQRQVAKVRVKRDSYATGGGREFDDPMYPQQWYLRGGALGGHDLGVAPAWAMGFTGRGTVVTILDDGFEHWHPDLAANYEPGASYDVNGRDSDPQPRETPSNDNRHGTRCAGEVAAKANNGICSVGVAYNARIGGIRMLDGPITDSVEAESLSFNQNGIDIYSASWGPDDDGRTVDGPGRLAKDAFVKGVTSGRRGLGNIFVWASGNGGNRFDSCACDGYANSVYTLSVSSVSQRNARPWYLEECTSTLAATYSSGGPGEPQVVTTDLRGQCTATHTGTSASAPIAAGIIALTLEANRNLTWRDVQHVTALSADSSFLTDGEWLKNAAGLRHSRRYGFGVMSAVRMVTLARLWSRPVPELLECRLPTVVVNQRVPSGGGLSVAVLVGVGGAAATAACGIRVLESVQLHLDATFANRGQLQVTLISPGGTRSLLLTPRRNDGHSGDCGFQEWPLMSVQFWRESPRGKWQVLVENRGSPANRGSVKSATLVLHGTAREPLTLWRPPMPLPSWLAPFSAAMNANSSKPAWLDETAASSPAAPCKPALLSNARVGAAATNLITDCGSPTTPVASKKTTTSKVENLNNGGDNRSTSLSAAVAMYTFVGVVSAIVVTCLVGYCCCYGDCRCWRMLSLRRGANGAPVDAKACDVVASGGATKKCVYYSQVSQTGSPERMQQLQSC